MSFSKARRSYPTTCCLREKTKHLFVVLLRELVIANKRGDGFHLLRVRLLGQVARRDDVADAGANSCTDTATNAAASQNGGHPDVRSPSRHARC